MTLLDRLTKIAIENENEPCFLDDLTGEELGDIEQGFPLLLALAQAALPFASMWGIQDMDNLRDALAKLEASDAD